MATFPESPNPAPSTHVARPPASGDGDEVTWITFLIAVLRYPRLLIVVPLLVVVAVAVTTLIRGHQFTAESRFLPEGAEGSEAVGLAAQLGLDLRQEGSESPEFYATLVDSRELLKGVALTRYQFSRGGLADTVQGTLIDIYHIEGDTEDARIREAIEMLRDDIVSVSTDRQTGIVTVQTATGWADLSNQINQRILDLVNEFNVERRQSRAAVERRFVEERLQQAREELQNAEAEVETFLARNRGYETSPQLRFEAARVQRQVDLRQQVYVTLSGAYERARIDEVRNTPVITVLDPPELPQRARGLIRRSAIAAVLGAGLGVALALAAEFVRRLGIRRPDLFADMRDTVRYAVGRLLPGRVP